MDLSKIKRCPHCGDAERGFVYEYVQRFTVSALWSDPASTAAESGKIVREDKFARCDACGFKVPVKVAEGAEPPSEKLREMLLTRAWCVPWRNVEHARCEKGVVVGGRSGVGWCVATSQTAEHSDNSHTFCGFVIVLPGPRQYREPTCKDCVDKLKRMRTSKDGTF